MHCKLYIIIAQLNWLQSVWYFRKENRKSVVCLVYVCLPVVCVDNITLEETKDFFMGFGIS